MCATRSVPSETTVRRQLSSIYTASVAFLLSLNAHFLLVSRPYVCVIVDPAEWCEFPNSLKFSCIHICPGTTWPRPSVSKWTRTTLLFWLRSAASTTWQGYRYIGLLIYYSPDVCIGEGDVKFWSFSVRPPRAPQFWCSREGKCPCFLTSPLNAGGDLSAFLRFIRSECNPDVSKIGCMC